MSKEIRLKKGLTINLVGDADKVYASAKPTEKTYRYVIKPTDFHGLTPKLILKVGDKVKAGSPIFIDKYNDKINFCSGVSGEVVDIIRGEKRKLLEVVVQAHKKNKYKKFNISNHEKFSKQKLKNLFFESGLWSLIQQRPFSIVADPLKEPKAIFISCFDSYFSSIF